MILPRSWDDSMLGSQESYVLDYLHVASGTTTVPTATVRLKKGNKELSGLQPRQRRGGCRDESHRPDSEKRGHLIEYTVQAVTQGKDALGEVTIKVDFGDGELLTGKGASTDVIEASARAYLNAVNRALLAGRLRKNRSATQSKKTTTP